MQEKNEIEPQPKLTSLNKSCDPRKELLKKQKKLGKLQRDPHNGKFYYGKPLSDLLTNANKAIEQRKPEDSSQNYSVTTKEPSFFSRKTESKQRLAVPIYNSEEPIKLDSEGRPYIGNKIDEIFKTPNQPVKKKIFILETPDECQPHEHNEPEDNEHREAISLKK